MPGVSRVLTSAPLKVGREEAAGITKSGRTRDKNLSHS